MAQIKQIQRSDPFKNLTTAITLISMLGGDDSSKGVRTERDPITGAYQAWKIENGEIVSVGAPKKLFENYPDVKLLGLANELGGEYSSQLHLSDKQVREKLSHRKRTDTDTMGYNWDDKQLNTFIDVYMDAYHPNQKLAAEWNSIELGNKVIKGLQQEIHGYESIATSLTAQIKNTPVSFWENPVYMESVGYTMAEYNAEKDDNVLRQHQKNYEGDFIAPLGKQLGDAKDNPAYMDAVKWRNTMSNRRKGKLRSMAGIVSNLDEDGYKDIFEGLFLSEALHSDVFRVDNNGILINPELAEYLYSILQEYGATTDNQGMIENLEKT